MRPIAFTKASFSFILLYRPSIAAVKISVLLLYRRIFPQKRFRILLHWYGAFVLVYTTLFVFLDMFHCRPVDRAWSTTDKSSCLNMDTIWVVGGSLNAITDIAALCLPMPLLWQLHLTKEKRLQLMGVFLLGGFVCIVSVIRVVELGGISSSRDLSYVFATTIIWSTVEVGVGIFCACLPVLRPIFNSLCPFLTNSNSCSEGLPRHHQPRSRRDTLRIKDYRPSDALGDRAPFAQVVTSVIRNSQSDDQEGQELAGNGITVVTDIKQKIVDMPI
ncbi:hypothetical protein N7G274_010510 [Stereocaulon virgatum]|uniref:Rhodopsin domain-containing protein n=1 Tax=Stereocaulon virgatum TaxID=373712 RepID=A0ABR3ZVW3_9LECA